jgi:dUTP pyrophosphatase
MTIINPKVALEKGWISGVKDPAKQVQPNAIDFTLDRAFGIEDYTQFVITESFKLMKGSTELDTFDYQGVDCWGILAGSKLDGLSDVYCDLPEGVCAQLVIRSTLARNGLLLTSGLYDSGFKGHVGFVLHNNSQTGAIVGRGTRVGQIILFQADSAGLYAGGYNHGQGTALNYQEQKCGCQSVVDEHGREMHGDSCKAMGYK